MALRLRGRSACFHAGIAGDASANVECAAVLECYLADDDLAVFEFDEPQGSILTERDVVADMEKVPAALQQVDAAMNVDALADAGAEQAQNHLLKDGSLE